MVTIHERCLGLTNDMCYFKILNFTSDCIFLHFSSPIDQCLQTVGLVNNLMIIFS